MRNGKHFGRNISILYFVQWTQKEMIHNCFISVRQALSGTHKSVPSQSSFRSSPAGSHLRSVSWPPTSTPNRCPHPRPCPYTSTPGLILVLHDRHVPSLAPDPTPTSLAPDLGPASMVALPLPDMSCHDVKKRMPTPAHHGLPRG